VAISKKTTADYVTELNKQEYKIGKTLSIFLDIDKPVKGWWKVHQEKREQVLENMRFRPEIANEAKNAISRAAEKMGKKASKITFIGIHSRRTDYMAYRKTQIEDTEDLLEDYYQDAMEHYREEYGEDTTAFLFVSDDMEWAKNNEILREEKNLFFEGCGNGADWSCVGRDLAILAACNHTIQTRGSFGQWAAYLSGGDSYTEYGPMMSQAIHGGDPPSRK